jgi:hypothetical protein
MTNRIKNKFLGKNKIKKSENLLKVKNKNILFSKSLFIYISN